MGIAVLNTIQDRPVAERTWDAIRIKYVPPPVEPPVEQRVHWLLWGVVIGVTGFGIWGLVKMRKVG